jgi:hypothetical protein
MVDSDDVVDKAAIAGENKESPCLAPQITTALLPFINVMSTPPVFCGIWATPCPLSCPSAATIKRKKEFSLLRAELDTGFLCLASRPLPANSLRRRLLRLGVIS